MQVRFGEHPARRRRACLDGSLRWRRLLNRSKELLRGGERVVAVADRLVVRAGTTYKVPERIAVLTERERDVLRLLAQGRSNAEIAADLVVG